MSNFWPRKWSQLRSKFEHWYSKRGIFKHHLTETQHCYSPDGRPMKVIVLKNGEVYITCMQFLSWRDSKNLLIYYDIFMTSAQELLFDRRSKEFWSLPYVHQILLLNEHQGLKERNPCVGGLAVRDTFTNWHPRSDMQFSLSATGHVLEVGWGGLMRMTLADKFVYYQKLFMRRGENVKQTLVGLMRSHVCIYSLLFPDHLVKEKRRAYTSLQINLNLWIST